VEDARFRDNVIKPSPCPLCRLVCDGAMSTGHGQGPSPGDYSVCLGCGAPLLFDDDLSLRQPTSDELQAMLEEPEYRKALSAVAIVLSQKG
jgi:hypothetical protein